MAVFAFHDSQGRPIAVPVTPYLDRWLGNRWLGRVVVTSTLAYIRKAELVKDDGRVAMLATGVHMNGGAEVTADLTGDAFVERYLEQEKAKYPPARKLTLVPLHRKLFAWYFGRAIIRFAPENVREVSGSDGATVIDHDDEGILRIRPVGAIDPQADEMELDVADLRNGPASILIHRESLDMSDLRWLRLGGSIGNGVFRVTSRTGSLEEGNRDSESTRRRNARLARVKMAGWVSA